MFDVDVGGGKLTNDNVFAEDVAPGLTERLRLDVEGKVWTGMGLADPKEDGVRSCSPNGDPIGTIHLPETCANVVFGGLLRNSLYQCASTSFYALYGNTQGRDRAVRA